MSQSNIYARGENGITPPFSADSRRLFNGAIPIQRRRYISESEIPGDYSKTPGGTLFGTTPGGTKIIYEIEQMKKLRSSPLAQTPPRNLPFIPGVTKNIHVDPLVNKQILNDLNNNRFKPANKVAPKIIEERADTDFMMEL